MATETQVVEIIRKEVGKSSQRQVAREKGITAAYLNDIIHGRRKVSAAVAALFGYEMTFQKTTTYRKVKP
jgi:plasmid maintenance system antidote protein VapI